MRIAMPDCFQVLFAWNIFSFFQFHKMPILQICVSCRQQNDIFCFLIHSTNLYLLIGNSRPLIFKAIVEKCVLISGILLLFECLDSVSGIIASFSFHSLLAISIPLFIPNYYFSSLCWAGLLHMNSCNILYHRSVFY